MPPFDDDQVIVPASGDSDAPAAESSDAQTTPAPTDSGTPTPAPSSTPAPAYMTREDAQKLVEQTRAEMRREFQSRQDKATAKLLAKLGSTKQRANTLDEAVKAGKMDKDEAEQLKNQWTLEAMRASVDDEATDQNADQGTVGQSAPNTPPEDNQVWATELLADHELGWEDVAAEVRAAGGMNRAQFRKLVIQKDRARNRKLDELNAQKAHEERVLAQRQLNAQGATKAPPSNGSAPNQIESINDSSELYALASREWTQNRR